MITGYSIPLLTSDQRATRHQDPAWVNPAHLPALAHLPADLDSVPAPVKVVGAVDLGICVECASSEEPVRDAAFTIAATDPSGHVSRDEVCGLHLHPAVHAHGRHGRLVVVEAPAQGTGFGRDFRQTWYADGPTTGVLVRRNWTGWDVLVLDADPRAEVVLQVWDAEYDWCPDTSRAHAELVGQAIAAQRAADAAELADVLPAVAA